MTDIDETSLAVDALLDGLLLPDDPALAAALADSQAAGMPPIEVSPQSARLLYLLTRTPRENKCIPIS